MIGCLVTGLLLVFCSAIYAPSLPGQASEKSCRFHPQLAGKCFSVRGRLSVYNGAPAVRLWRVGTRRMLGVSEQRFNEPGYRNLPESLEKQLNDEIELFGSFLVCPFTKPRPSEMQLVCIESAKNILIKHRPR